MLFTLIFLVLFFSLFAFHPLFISGHFLLFVSYPPIFTTHHSFFNLPPEALVQPLCCLVGPH